MTCTTGDCGVGNYSGTVMDSLVTLTAPLVNEGLPLIRVTRGGSLGLADFLFEKKLVESDGEGAIVYKVKEGIGGGTKFQRVFTNNDCQVEWREQLYTKPSAKLATAVSADNELVVDNTKGLRGINKGSSVILTQTNGKLARARVESISGNTITLASNVSITADAGTCIYRGPYGITNECGANIDNKYELRQSVKYVSNFTRINLSLEFQTCELSLDRLVNYLGDSKNGAQKFVSELV